MHATSTPTLAQPKPGAYLALGLTAILAAAIGVGAIVALNGRTVTAPTVGSQTSIEEALAAKNAAEGAFVSLPSPVNGIESGIAAKNAIPSVVLSNDQIRAMVEQAPYPTVVIPSVVLSNDQIRAMVERPPFPQAATTTSAYDAFREANGWHRPIVAIPSVILSNDQIRAMVERPPFPTVVGEGNTDLVGTSHR